MLMLHKNQLKMSQIFKLKPQEFRKKIKCVFATSVWFGEGLLKYGFELFGKGMKTLTNENLKTT